MRALKITLGALGILVLLLLLAVALVVGTQTGTRLALRGIEPLLPDGVEIGGYQGRLADRLVLDQVSVRTDTMHLRLARAAVHWSPMQLLRGHLEIHELLVDGVRYEVLETPEEPEVDEPLPLPDEVELPVSVAVQRLLIRDVEVLGTPDQGRLLALDEIQLSGRFADAELELTRLEVRGPEVTLQGHATLTAAADYPLAARAVWRFELPDYAPLVGETVLDGSLDALQLRQELAAPYHLTLSASIHHLLTEEVTPVIAATLSLAELQLAAVAEGLPEASLTATASIAGPLDELEIEADLAGIDPEQRRFEAAVGALIRPEELVLRRLQVTQPGRPGALRGAGHIALGDALSGDLEVTWEALQWPLTGEPTVVSPRGRLSFVGPPDGYQLSLDARLEPDGQPPLELRLSGEGDRDAMAVSLNAEVASGRLGGEARLTWSPELHVAAQLQGRGLDPAVLAEDWPGAIDFTGEVTLELTDEVLAVRIDGLEVEGRLRDEPLSLVVDGRYAQIDAEHSAVIERFRMTLGSTRLAVSGRVDEQVDLRWDASSADLSELLPDAGGRMRGGGSVSGRYPQLQVDASLEGRGLTYGDDQLGELLLRADLDLTGATESRFELIASEGSLAGVELQQLAANAAGTPGDHRLQISLAAADVGATAELTGSFDEPWDETERWSFVIGEAQLRYGALAPWRLDGSAAGTVGPEIVQIERHCWRAADADLCLAAAAGPEGVTARAELSELGLEYFAPLGPEDLQLTGAVTARAQFALAPDGLLTGEFQLDTSPGQAVLPQLADADVVDAGLPPRLRFEPSQLSAILEPDQARVSAAVNLDYGRIRVEAMTAAAVVIGADGPPLSEQEVTGLLEIDVPDLAFLPEMLPAVARTEGSLVGRLQLNGTLRQPISSGSVVLRDGAATLPVAGVRITDFAATLEGRGLEGIHLEAVAASGPGQLTVDGMLHLFGDVPSAALAIQGSEFEIMNTEDARILASPDLTLQADQQRIQVSGVVAVPRAELTPVMPEPGAALPSADQVLVDEEVEPAPPRELHAEIRLVPGDEVHFVGFGLDARIEGDVVVRESPATPVTTATGELSLVDGEYRAYGQVLAIERGRIFFAGGPVTEPAVDIEAVRRPREGILVGARVSGTLDAPDFSLFSEPPMSEQEQLAYLVLGRSLDEAPGGEGSVLAQAALALGLRGGDALAQEIGDWIGLDELAIVTRPDQPGAEDDPGQAALVMGTYLSPRLYVSYGIGLFEPGSVLQLQYEISRRWRLVTRSGGEGSGVDLLFTLERGGN